MKSKKLVSATMVAIIFSFFGQQVNAQFAKKSWLVEGNIGNVGVSNSNYTYESGASITEYDSKGFSFGIYPKAGYFFTNNLAVGASLSFGASTNKQIATNATGLKNSEYSSNYTSVGLSPFVRYYFAGKEKLRFYGQVQGGIETYFSYNSESTSYNSLGVATSKYKSIYVDKPFSFNYGGLVGLNYFLSKNVALNTGVGYRIYSTKYITNNENTNLLTGVTTTSPNDTKYTSTSGYIDWNIGFTMFLGGNQSADK